MTCKICKGNLYYLVYDKHADNMAKMDCWDCLSVIQYNDDVKERLSKLLVSASPQKLAQIVAEILVNTTEDYEVENTFEPLIATKDKTRLLVLGEIKSEMIKNGNENKC
tara:strand:- start:94 stop:420 length:327 start_codon:yes stop_codon:yes gene_type:complete